MRQMSIDILSNFIGFNRFFVLVYSNEDNNSKIKITIQCSRGSSAKICPGATGIFNLY